MSQRYIVNPSDDGTSIEDQKRSRSWDVIDRVTNSVVSNHLTRDGARSAAREANDETRVTDHDLAARVVAKARAHGNDAQDARDAAHELAHVAQVNRIMSQFCGPYERENIHRQLARAARKGCGGFFGPEVQMAVFEFEARAVEWLVCDAIGQPYDADHWVGIMLLESHASGIRIPGGTGANINRIQSFRTRKPALAIVKQLLGESP